jgi:signal transduction histidine kinase
MVSPPDDADRRVETFTQDADLGVVASILAARRAEILDCWLAAATHQPFHQGHPERTVADHIPPLFDALVALLQRSAPRWIDPGAPLDDPAVLQAAQNHAHARFQAGLGAADIVTEFRLLRQEIGRTLRRHLADEAPSTDVVGAELLVNDALDGAITLSIATLAHQVEEARQDFLARTVHDVRQPLTALSGSLQWARHLLAAPEPNSVGALDALRRAQAAAEQMLTVLITLGDAARLALGLGPVDLRVTEVDLVAVVEAALGRLAPQAAARVQVTVAAGTATGGWWDRAALGRVLDNLLSNALKYSPPGTPIDLTVRGDADALLVGVRDRGIGLPPEDLERLFERYSRASEAVVRGIPGEGLGLYVACGLVEAHAGRIWAESAGAGQGTTFYVRLPYGAAPAQAGGH